MKINRVQFISPINFGGTLHSISNEVTGIRPGEKAAKIEMDEKNPDFVLLSKEVNGKLAHKLVPMTNIAGIDVEMPEPAPVEVKKK